MLKQLRLHSVGPSEDLEAEFGSRLNVLLGDNSLGKTFLLDVAWWALTRTWAGRPAAPVLKRNSKPSISFTFDTTTKTAEKLSRYDRELQHWPRDRGRPPNPGLAVYARVDGGFSVWDPAQNYWRTRAGVDDPERPAAFHFTTEQVWGGFARDPDGKTYCRGLIEDWASWQRDNGDAFRQFSAVLRDLSPDGESLTPGELTRVAEESDRRDIPTLLMPYGPAVPIVYASAAVKRILALAYLLVWTWTEHQRMSELRGLALARQVIFLVDELEAHLHPRWQRTIVRALLDVVGAMHAKTAVQIIAATHSPLVLASLEPYFDLETDRLLHLQLRDGKVILEELPWAKEGDVSAWLVSDAFGLTQARSVEAERAIEAAEAWMRGDEAALPGDLKTRASIQNELARVLPSMDPFWPRWIVRAENLA
jgi:hypothetical protein